MSTFVARKKGLIIFHTERKLAPILSDVTRLRCALEWEMFYVECSRMLRLKIFHQICDVADYYNEPGLDFESYDVSGKRMV